MRKRLLLRLRDRGARGDGPPLRRRAPSIEHAPRALRGAGGGATLPADRRAMRRDEREYLDQLRAGAPFDKLARQAGTSPDARAGGDFAGSPGHHAQGVRGHLLLAGDRERFRVVQSPLWLHVFKSLGRRAARAKGFERRGGSGTARHGGESAPRPSGSSSSSCAPPPLSIDTAALSRVVSPNPPRGLICTGAPLPQPDEEAPPRLFLPLAARAEIEEPDRGGGERASHHPLRRPRSASRPSWPGCPRVRPAPTAQGADQRSVTSSSTSAWSKRGHRPGHRRPGRRGAEADRAARRAERPRHDALPARRSRQQGMTLESRAKSLKGQEPTAACCSTRWSRGKRATRRCRPPAT